MIGFKFLGTKYWLILRSFLSFNLIKFMFFAAFFYYPSSGIVSQTCDDLVLSATSAICINDTVAASVYLDKYINNCKKDKLLPLVFLMQSEIYVRNKHEEKAIESLKNALLFFSNNFSVYSFRDTCHWMAGITKGNYIISQYLFLIKISDLYAKKNDFHTAINYLNMIDRDHIPGFSGCVNGMRMIETEIAIRYADCYFNLKDTLNGVHRLVDYAIYNEGDISDKLIKRLKEILVKKYTQAQIVEEIEQSIVNAKEVVIESPSGFKSKRAEYYLFGRKIPYMYLNLEELKNYIVNNKNLLYLRS